MREQEAAVEPIILVLEYCMSLAGGVWNRGFWESWAMGSRFCGNDGKGVADPEAAAQGGTCPLLPRNLPKSFLRNPPRVIPHTPPHASSPRTPPHVIPARFRRGSICESPR